ncbi:unnamed protein product, partial [Oncorhynchus mykiss]
MPAWKREILERRKAKGGGSGAGAAEPCPSASSSRVNGEVTGNSSAPKKDNESNADSVRNYTIIPASQHFAGKRGSSPTSPELSPKTVNDGEEQESLVLQDSLGPLQENPFIKLEKERKKRQDRECAIRPVQHILELYGSVPGIRTIRAENIIIIESDPDYFPGASGIKSGAGGVTEIRAKEVVIYDTTLSRSEENLSTLSHPCHEGAFETGEGQGRVSRMLQKFDSNYGKLQPKSRSTDNLLDLEISSSRPRQRPKPQPDLVPKYKSHAQPSSPVRTLGNTQSSSSVFPSSHPTTPLMSPPSPGFKIRPSPRPDLSLLPSGDIQARALANLRLQSRNSFTVFPKRHRAASSPESTAPSSPIKFPPSQRLAEMPTPGVPIPITPPPTPAASKRKEEVRAARPTKPDPPLPTATQPPSSPSPAPSSVPSVQSPPPEDAPADQLPVTNIDDIDVDPSKPVFPSPTPVVHGRKGNTFTVVPKRKSEPQPGSPEPQEPCGGAQTPPTPSQAPYAQLGSLLKKRYPAVEEIEVIGGYQSLGRSCLIKTGSTGKKVRHNVQLVVLHM